MLFLVLLVSPCLLLAAHAALKAWRLKRLSRSNGCAPPVSIPRPFWDTYGLISTFQAGKVMKEYKYFPAMQKKYASFGNSFVVKLMGRETFSSVEPKNIQNVLSANSRNWGVFHRRVGFDEYAGRGFLSTDGNEHEKWQQFIRPSFEKINTWDHQTYEWYLRLMLHKIPQDGSTFDLQELIKLLYLDTATLFLFGESVGALSGDTPTEKETFLRSNEYVLRAGGLRLLLGPLRHLYYNKKMDRCMQDVHRFVDKYIDRAIAKQRKSGEEGERDNNKTEFNNLTSKGRYNMLNAMVQQTSDRVAIRNNLIQGFIASHDTTGFLISNVLWLLARNPGLWTELRAKILEQIDTDPELTFDTPGKIRLLNNIIDETLRLYPVFAHQSRDAYDDCTLPTGGGPSGDAPIFVPAGSMFDANFMVLHRRKDIYGEDADEWKPQRWDILRGNLPPWTYLPFGGGQRACLGKAKALAETGYFVCRMAQEFERLEPRDDRPWTGAVMGTVSNVNGCWIACVPASKG